jgi:hypothetical protein
LGFKLIPNSASSLLRFFFLRVTGLALHRAK